MPRLRLICSFDNNPLRGCVEVFSDILGVVAVFHNSVGNTWHSLVQYLKACGAVCLIFPDANCVNLHELIGYYFIYQAINQLDDSLNFRKWELFLFA